jgi:hypothetical protein
MQFQSCTSRSSLLHSLVEFLLSVKIELCTLRFKFMFNPFPLNRVEATKKIVFLGHLFNTCCTSVEHRSKECRSIKKSYFGHLSELFNTCHTSIGHWRVSNTMTHLIIEVSMFYKLQINKINDIIFAYFYLLPPSQNIKQFWINHGN